MTPKEAIDHLVCGRINCLNNADEDEKLRNLCIHALEKQIPKKPAHDFRGLYDMCPVCYKNGVHIMVSIPENIPKIKYNFCPYCGQAIDWMEDNE